ncbi:A/G-specific adenine glycosylase [Sphingomicrobium sp. XHP0239]|uniref:A/G-specific adenine glycosylase n=1 Tax=Sphingomicrobium maritimum TaxID=3133972 RepID=UPI0031CC6063
MRQSVKHDLVTHYREHARDLPWRIAPGGNEKPDPYRIWLSEVMLQQTTVATVGPRFRSFVERWPTVESLAESPVEDLLAAWAGLGYYARARNLHACAVRVAARGGFPDTEAALRELPGIGDYTAAAIAAIAFGRDAVVVDTNVERVVARLIALDRPVREEKALIRDEAAKLYDGMDAGTVAQALMDLGATICRPRDPRCSECPLRAHCAAFATGTPAAFPPRPARKDRPDRHGTAWWIERDGAIFLVRRPGRGMLGGMAALPGSDWHDGPLPPTDAPSIVHGFTHFTLALAIEPRAEPDAGAEGWWQPLDRLDEAGLPTLYKKAIAAMQAAHPRLPLTP